MKPWFRGLRRSYIHPPQNWLVLESKGPGPFITRETYQRPDGKCIRWHSRQHRKRGRSRSLLKLGYWAPQRLAWWISVLFMIGSALFALGVILSLLPDSIAVTSGGVFFVGSIFFTVAAYLQFLESINASPYLEPRNRNHPPQSWQWLAWQPERIDWWSTSTQFIGTIFFNFNTYDAMLKGLSAVAKDVVVWVPDVLGSILFLVSSLLAYQEITNSATSPPRRDWCWWIAWLNLLGSLAFGISAITGFFLPQSGQVLSLAGTNLFTFLGAICFFLGAFFLLPEMVQSNRSWNV